MALEMGQLLAKAVAHRGSIVTTFRGEEGEEDEEDEAEAEDAAWVTVEAVEAQGWKVKVKRQSKSHKPSTQKRPRSRPPPRPPPRSRQPEQLSGWNGSFFVL
eukprot:GHVN01084827.1.p2 GENE.GHVN01084827.1~~GHVN01084827.1.p2  ORF type:complete len:102 (-),score=14.77 GHVN01084827.1:85-390(-)